MENMVRKMEHQTIYTMTKPLYNCNGKPLNGFKKGRLDVTFIYVLYNS